MVSELHARKAALEAKLAEKNRELRLLCIQEAELTGILPPETPLEPGESPPTFRRRVGTAFTLPENLINNNKPKYKEEDTLAAIELEIQIQTKISEANLGLGSDPNLAKSVRRKQRQNYQLSQRKLADLEARASVLRSLVRNQQPKQRKKPRPQQENESAVDRDSPGLLHDGGISLSPPPVGGFTRPPWDTTQNQQHHEPLMRHSSTHDGISHHRQSRHNQPMMHPQLHRQGSGGYFAGPTYAHSYSTLATCAHPEIERLEGRRERLDQGVSTPGYWLRYEANETESAWFATAPRQIQRAPYAVRQPTQQDHHPPPTVRDSRGGERFTGSLDRRKVPPVLHGGSSPSLETWNTPEETEVQRNSAQERLPQPAYVHPLPARQNIPPPVMETLLPGQTYPENGIGLVRTHSMGSVEAMKKNKEKEWYETSLDTGPVPLPSRRAETGSDGGSNISRSSSNVSAERRPLVSRSREIPQQENFETTVPFESPKNHTVVEAGKWQPYREVTKPFEMADFYKYSTKFRKNENPKPSTIGRQNENARPVPGRQAMTSRQAVGSNTSPVPVIHPRGVGPTIREQPAALTEVLDAVPQQKGIYQPLQPMACNPIDPNIKNPSGPVEADAGGDAFSSEAIAWYQDKSLPRSATLV